MLNGLLRILGWSLIGCLVIGLATFRFKSLIQFDQLAVESHGPKDGIGITVRWEKHSPTTPVLLWHGRDERPGQAGWDDDMNGQTDELGELGAVHSDDALVIPRDDDYTAAQASSVTRIMFYGAYEQVEGPALAQRRIFSFKDQQGNPRVWWDDLD